MKRFFKSILLVSIIASIGLLGSCQKKGDEKSQQRPSSKETPEIPAPVTKNEKIKAKPSPENSKDSSNKQPVKENKSISVTQRSSQMNNVPKVKVQETAKEASRVAVKFQFDVHGADITSPIVIKYGDKVLGNTRLKELNLNLKKDFLGKRLSINAPYFEPVPPVTVTENSTEFNIDLLPLLVKIKVSDSVGIYSKDINDVRIYSNDKFLGKTNGQGIAQIRAAHVGANNYIFFKPHFFSRQSHIVRINSKNALIKVALLPLKHFINIKILDERNRPLSNQGVELTKSGLAIHSLTNKKGIVTLKSFNLKSGEKYQLHISSLDYTDNEFTFPDTYFDEARKYISIKIPVKYKWKISASDIKSELALYDFKGRKIAEGTGYLDVKIPRGTYKIIAKSGSITKEALINATDSPAEKKVIMDECYSYAQEWSKKNPGNDNLPDEIINCLKDIHTSDPNFINSRMLLAKVSMKNKQYGNAKIFYENILRYDHSKRYDPVILYNTAQALILFSDKIKKGRDKLQLLDQASSDYLDNASAYITKLPIRSRKKWIIKIEYLKGELYQRYFFYYKKIDSFELARQNGNAALDAFNSFIRDYKSLASSSSLKQLLKKDYERAEDLAGSIRAAQAM